MEQYKFFAECFLPKHMLDWFDLKKIDVIGEGDDKQYQMRMKSDPKVVENFAQMVLHERAYFRIFPFVPTRCFFI